MRQKLAVALIVLGLLNPLPAFGAPPPQDTTGVEDAEVTALMDTMSAEQRVGQLFLVTFTGSDATVESDIGRLVREGRVGGVVLSAANDNFTDEEDLLGGVLQLTRDLQALGTESAVSEDPEAEAAPVPDGPYVPLFIAVEQDGQGGHVSQLLSGVTPLPTDMAIGATWDPTYAEEVGRVAGQELDALGINMLLGPSLDVLETPQLVTGDDLGVRSFGGDPFWVAQMGAAYVRGFHDGGQGRVAIIPQHFPGLGSADRPPDVEISTVPRSLARLVQVDLAPFFAVTGIADDPTGQADGLMTAHIRYLGFQGDNPRLRTQPISLDPQALQVLMGQAQIVTWREEGGLLVSGPLGQRSIRRFYDPSEITFPNRRIAQDAFLAGNDLLYLADFGPAPGEVQTETVMNTIDFFVQKYEEDPTFQARVDEAVALILRQKLDQFGDFSLSRVQRSAGRLATIGEGRDLSFSVAQAALTLLSPSRDELSAPPAPDDVIVVFTDTRSVAQCSTCEPQPLIPANALSDAILRLYGPAASGLVQAGNVQSYPLSQLAELLDFAPTAPEEGEATPEPNPAEIALGNADWVIFLMLDVDPDTSGSDAVKRFLAERPDVASGANVVVMAMDAPYYLDSTEISKLSAYYALYDHSEASIDMAARAIFQEALPAGASPVSVPGINYDLLTVTSPDPLQVIELYAGEVTTDAAGTPEPLELAEGDTLRVRTGVIVDLNGHPVPDGTPVDFDINFVSEGLRNTQRATTVGGVAQGTLVLGRGGEIEVTALSEPAQLSYTLVVIVQDEGGVTIFPQPPEVTPATPQGESATEPPPEQAIGGGTPTPEPTPVPPPPPPGSNVTFLELLLTMLGLLVVGGIAFQVGRDWGGHVNDGLYFALPTLVGGLLVFNYFAFKLPGAVDVQNPLTVVLVAWGGGILGFGIAYAIRRWGRRLVSAGGSR